MERIVRLQIERLPEGVYLGTSEDVQGLVIQAETAREVIELAPGLIQDIWEVRAKYGFPDVDRPLPSPPDRFEVPILIAA